MSVIQKTKRNWSGVHPPDGKPKLAQFRWKPWPAQWAHASIKETIKYQRTILTAAPPQRNFLISTNYLFLSQKHWTSGDKKGIGQLAMLNDYKTNKTFPWNTTYKKSSEIGNVSLNGPFIYKYAYMWTKCNDRQWNTNSVQNPHLNIFYNIMCKHWPWCNA